MILSLIMGSVLWMGEISAGVPVETVGAIIVAVLSASGGVLFGRIRRTSTTLEGQPINVRMDDHYVTRREFDKLSTDMDRNMAEIKGMMAQVFQRLNDSEHKLSSEIKELAANEYEWRTKVWEVVNDQRERLASVESRCASTHSQRHNTRNLPKASL